MSQSNNQFALTLGVGAALGAGLLSFIQRAQNQDMFGTGPSLMRKLSFKTPPAIVIVDPISSGMMLARLLSDRGYAVIRVYSSQFPTELVDLVPKNITEVEWHGTIYHEVGVKAGEPANSKVAPERGSKEHKKALTATMAKIKAIKGVNIENIMVGCESGVELCDELTERWINDHTSTKEAPTHVTTNGTNMSMNRRDKYPMGESVRKAGIRAVKQIEVKGGKFEEVEEFVKSCIDPVTKTFRVVLKPAMSAGSEGVYFATTLDECRLYFDEIYGATNVFGEVNDKVLCQEFLQGKEYVVDSVSVEGVHKTVAIWEYDKRKCNGAQFVYFGMRLFESADGKIEEALVGYMHKVLDALQVRHGPSHGEVIMTASGPCLVEVGCRPHGGEGTFVKLAESPIGYNQLSVMVDAHENRSKFYNLPTRPKPLKSHSMEVCLVNRSEGRLLGIPKLDLIKALPSFAEFEQKCKFGENLALTVDFLTSPGAVMLCHSSREQMEKDQEFIHELEENGLFDIRRMRMDTL